MFFSRHLIVCFCPRLVLFSVYLSLQAPLEDGFRARGFFSWEWMFTKAWSFCLLTERGCRILYLWNVEWRMNEYVNLNWTQHTEDMFQMEQKVLFGAQRNAIWYQTNISLWGILGKNVWYFDIFLSLSPRYKGKTADLELPLAAAL